MTTQEAIVALEEEANRLRRLAPQDEHANISFSVLVLHPEHAADWSDWVGGYGPPRVYNTTVWLQNDAFSEVTRIAYLPSLQESAQ